MKIIKKRTKKKNKIKKKIKRKRKIKKKRKKRKKKKRKKNLLLMNMENHLVKKYIKQMNGMMKNSTGKKKA